MKTKDELNTLKEEAETVSRKLHELSEEELAEVSGGVDFGLLRVLMGIIFEPPASLTGGQTISE